MRRKRSRTWMSRFTRVRTLSTLIRTFCAPLHRAHLDIHRRGQDKTGPDLGQRITRLAGALCPVI